eukprot:3021998-Lingulodinium_polyedra.AAC.1
MDFSCPDIPYQWIATVDFFENFIANASTCECDLKSYGEASCAKPSHSWGKRSKKTTTTMTAISILIICCSFLVQACLDCPCMDSSVWPGQLGRLNPQVFARSSCKGPSGVQVISPVALSAGAHSRHRR